MKRLLMTLCALILLITPLLASKALALPGDFDPAFGQGDVVTTAVGSSPSFAGSMKLQGDGKIVVAGHGNDGSKDSFALARYNADGSLDSTFDEDGIVSTTLGPSDSQAKSVTIQADGKIIAAGYVADGVGGQSFALVRYNADGSLDPTFGSNGVVTTSLGGSSDAIYDAVLQGDGKIVAVGTSVDAFTLARYNEDGSQDTTFGGLGTVSFSIGGGSSSGYALALQQDGKIVAAGVGSTPSAFVLIRVDSNGDLDSTFGGGGVVTTPIGVSASAAYGIALQGDGKILVAGQGNDGTTDSFALARYNDDGSLDTTFSDDGIVLTNVGNTAGAGAMKLAIQNDAKIIAAGMGYLETAESFALVRYNRDGSLDEVFGGDGIVNIGIGAASSAVSLAINWDGNIVVAGNSAMGGGVFTLARFVAGPAGELALRGAKLLDSVSLAPVASPLADMPILASVTLQNAGSSALPETTLVITDLTEGTTTSIDVPALEVGDSRTLEVPFTFTGDSGCRELIFRAALPGPMTQLQLMVPLGEGDACSGGGIEVVANNIQTIPAGKPLAAGTRVVVSGTSSYVGFTTPPLGAEVTIELIKDDFVRVYKTYTRSPDGSWFHDFVLPENIGDYTVEVKISDSQVRGETSQAITILPGSGPNLYPYGIEFTGVNIYRPIIYYGDTVTSSGIDYARTNAEVGLSLYVANRGVNSATGNLKIQFFVDDNSYPAPDTLVCETIKSVNLPAASTSVRITCDGWVPETAGKVSVYAVIDPDNDFIESREDDNNTARFIDIRNPGPNLVPMGIFAPMAPGPDEVVTLTANVYNYKGFVDLEASTYNVEFYDGEPGRGGVLIDTQRMSSNIPVGAKVAASIEWDTTGLSPGYHNIWTVVDAAAEVDEFIETDNKAFSKIDVLSKTPNLQVMSIDAPNNHRRYNPSIAINTTITISAQIKNRSVLASLDKEVGFYLGDPESGGTLLKKVACGSLARGESKPLNISWTPTQAMSNRIYARVEPAGQAVSLPVYVYDGNLPPNVRVLSGDIMVSGTATSRQLGGAVSVSAYISETSDDPIGPFSVKFTAEGPDLQDLGTRRISLSGLQGSLVTAPSQLRFNARKYVVKVEVVAGDWNGSDNAATQMVDALGGVPNAIAGPDLSIIKGTLVYLGNRASVGPNFVWSVLQAPSGSVAALQQNGSAIASFRPDLPGTYVVELQANNGFDFVYDQAVIQVRLASCPTPTVSIPGSSNNGNYKLSWNGTVNGAVYVVEESFNGGAFTQVYAGTAPYVNFYNKVAGSYSYRVKSSAPGLLDSLWSQAGNCVVSLSLDPPKFIQVPTTSDTGTFKISFGSSNAADITYILEESANAGAFIQVYAGLAPYAYVSGRPGGSYVYRVKATKSGFTQSSWQTSAACVVAGGSGNFLTLARPNSISVPLTNATGSYKISFGASSVSGVTYVLEESFEGSAWSAVYTGIAPYAFLYNRPNSGAYTYRVKAVKSGYSDSTWAVSGDCNVNLVLSVPSNIAVSASASSVKVSYGASNVADVTYLVEESKDSGVWQQVYLGKVSYVYLNGRSSGSYQYRVKATKTNYVDSDWKYSGAFDLP